MTRDEAIDYCTKRWHAQCRHYPTIRNEIPLNLYIRANVDATMKLKPDSELNKEELRIRSLALS